MTAPPTGEVMRVVALADLKHRPSRPIDWAHVESLAASMAAIGLLAPVPVDADGNALAGEHRIQAAIKLGWTHIPTVTKTLEGLQAELATLDENLVRHNGDALWRAEAYKKRQELYEALHPEAKHGGARAGAGRKSSGHGGHLKNEDPPAEVPAARPPSFAADTAAAAQVSERSVRRHISVAEKLDPEVKEAVRGTPVAESITELEQLSSLPQEKQREVARRAVEEGETVKRAVKKLRKEERVAEVKAYVPPAGEFAVIATDVPWKYEDELDGSDAARGGLPYPPMELEEICALKVPAAKDCILWFWVTNTHLINGNAAKVLEAWGFTPKTLYTWDKVLMANGRWGRGQTEHVILAVRGRPVGVFEAERNLFSEQRAQVHSRKPEAFYKLVERSCPCPPEARLEMFATQEREGWVTSGAQLGTPKPAPAPKRGFHMPLPGLPDSYMETEPAPSLDRRTTGGARRALLDQADQAVASMDPETRGAVARVGINALVDEATDYQDVRPKDDLRQQLKREAKTSMLSVERFRAEATDLGFATTVGKHRTVRFVACRCGAKGCPPKERELRAAITQENLVDRAHLQELRDHAQEHARARIGAKRSRGAFGHEPMRPGWKDALRGARRAKKGGRR